MHINMTNTINLRATLRAISQFHENEKLIQWLQRQWLVIFLTPKRRRVVLFIGALFVGFKAMHQRFLRSVEPSAADALLATSLTFPILLTFVYLLYLAAAHFQKLPGTIKQRPQVALHLLFWGILALLWLAPEEGGTWRQVFTLFAISLPFLLWRCGYMLKSGQRNNAQRTSFRDHLFYLWPVWGGTFTPIGKGADYLSRCEAKTPDAYARSILAALKLLLLMLLLDLFRQVLAAILYGDPRNSFTALLGGYNLAFPRLSDIAAGKTQASLITTWLAVYLELIWETLRHAIPGHKWVALLRLCGFNVFRNTYKPLLAESVLDFWNRYYYYFKELLLEFFFFPTYLRYFRTWPKLRIFAAIFAAAFVGNMYYHFLQARVSLAEGQVLEVAESMSPRMIYCFLLTVGIYVSTLRQQHRRGQSEHVNSTTGGFIKLRHIAGVWTFFSLINLWNTRTITSTPERIRFFFSLFGF
jgi:hypothetical protein